MRSPRHRRRKRTARRPAKPACSARRLSYDVLTAWQERGAFAGRVIDDLCRQRRVSFADRALAVDLTYTAIRRQATLDAILSTCVDRPRSNVEDGLWRILQIGCCQLVLMDRVPAHAAVHETAELAKQLQQPQWTGLINGVLRTLAKSISEAPASDGGVDAVPLGGGRFRKLDRAVFPDSQVDRVESLTRAYSYPRWLVRDWLEQFDIEETTRLCDWFNTPSLPAVRVNLLSQSRDVVRETLEAAGIATRAGTFPESLVATTSFRPLDVPGFREGWFSIQDESAMGAARMLSPGPGELVLDVCAAPGGKTTHLAELMQNTGRIIATDSDALRLQLVTESIERLGLSCIETQLVSPQGEDLPEGPFDAILVDVPCSNTGVLGKRPEARWRITAETVDELVPTQIRLLTQALQRVRPGGRVVYSTCSIDPRENRQVVDAVLSNTEGFTLEDEQRHIPGKPADGGYQALLRKTSSDRSQAGHNDVS